MARQRKLRPGVDLLSINDLPGATTPEGSKDVYWGTARIHAKVQDVDQPFMVANEFIGARLAMAVGLPALPGEVARYQGKKVWVTPQVTDETGITAPPIPEDLTTQSPEVAAGIQVFDIWVANVDRHSGNILFSPKIGAWLIDHEDILAGPTGEHINNRFDGWIDGTQFLGTARRSDRWVKKWCLKIANIHGSIVPPIIDEAYSRDLLDASSRDKYKQVLSDRGRDIFNLVETYSKHASGSPTTSAAQLNIFDGGES